MKYSDTYTYGNNPEFEFEKLSVTPAGELQSTVEVAQRVSLTEDAYHKALEDVNSTFRVEEDKQSGKSFEIAIVNPGASSGFADVELSTYSSSISGNIGNAIEFAEHAALNPARARIYVASFGNGGSSYWDESERKHITESGRFTQRNGESLPTVDALSRVLQRLGGLTVNRFSTNSAGGAYATALMRAMPEGQITNAYIKSRPNISNHPSGPLWGAGLMLSELKDSKNYKANTEDTWDLTANVIKNAEPRLSAIYGDKAVEWSMKGASEKGVKKLYWDMKAFSKGGAKYNFPASIDTAVALRQQPEAQMTFHFPEKDRLYGDLRQDVAEFLKRIHALNAFVQPGQVEAAVMPGTHHDHSQYPSLRWSIENYALNR